MVTSNGRVFSSEDGLSVSTLGTPEFRQAKIVQVACGEVHSLARDDQGRCWAWGLNGFGQLAQGAYSHSNLKLAQPTLIKADAEVVKIAAGGNTSYFVLKDQGNYKVKSAGMGQWGQLGDDSVSRLFWSRYPTFNFDFVGSNIIVYFIVYTHPGISCHNCSPLQSR